jgi:hypothetical protein
MVLLVLLLLPLLLLLAMLLPVLLLLAGQAPAGWVHGPLAGEQRGPALLVAQGICHCVKVAV